MEALSPQNPYSNFIDLQTGETFSTEDVFMQFYAREDGLTIQTCNADGKKRIFFIGVPATR